MTTISKIEWTEQTWNPTVGCTKISPGCKHCYAEAMAKRLKAMGTPGYQLLLNDRLTTGKGAGVIATSHTLGYGVSALLVPVVTRFYGEQSLTVAAWGMAVLFLALSIGVRSTERTPSGKP